MISRQMMCILGILAGRSAEDWYPPTNIGRTYGKQSSSWASRKLRRLKELGYVERNKRGHWRLTAAGALYWNTHKEDT